MTELLEKAIAQVQDLPAANQDAIAQLILEELEDERLWDEAFAHEKSPALLEKLLAEAEAEQQAGLVQDCD
ncbi:MAG: hypothetical protein AAF267_14320 [Deinococcota bacterium]